MPNFISGQYKKILKNAKTKSFFRKKFMNIEKNGHLIKSKLLTPIFSIFRFRNIIIIFVVQNKIMRIIRIFSFMEGRKFTLAQDKFT